MESRSRGVLDTRMRGYDDLLWSPEFQFIVGRVARDRLDRSEGLKQCAAFSVHTP
jgi:hypothetical protein